MDLHRDPLHKPAGAVQGHTMGLHCQQCKVPGCGKPEAPAKSRGQAFFKTGHEWVQEGYTAEGGCRPATLSDRICCGHTCWGGHTLLAQPHISGVWALLPSRDMERNSAVLPGALITCRQYKPTAMCHGRPSTARPLQVAEISRVLKPGGVFVASTFLKASAPLGQLFNNDDIFRPLNAVCLLLRTDSA